MINFEWKAPFWYEIPRYQMMLSWRASRLGSVFAKFLPRDSEIGRVLGVLDTAIILRDIIEYS